MEGCDFLSIYFGKIQKRFNDVLVSNGFGETQMKNVIENPGLVAEFIHLMVMKDAAKNQSGMILSRDEAERPCFACPHFEDCPHSDESPLSNTECDKFRLKFNS